MAKPRGGGSCELTERPRGLADAGRSRAEVRLDEERLTREPGGCAAPDHLANREHVAALHDRECLPRVLLDEQDRRALLVEPLDHPHDLFDDEGTTILLVRSEEHTSELQSPYDLVCRPLL